MNTRLALGLAVALIATTPALARVGGGAVPATDCLAEFDGVTETAPGSVVCADGDPCDADGATDDGCEFRISVCAFQSDRAACTPSPIRKFDHNNRHLALPPVPVTDARCGATTSVRVPLRGKGAHPRPSRPAIVKLRARSGRSAVDANRFELRCVPHGSGTSTTVTSTTTTSTTATTFVCAAECNSTSDGPSELDLTVGAGSDLDLGWTGYFHDLPVPTGFTLQLCAAGCDATTTPNCQLSGSTGVAGAGCSLNGPTLGPPFPLIAGGIPICIVNEFSEAAVTGEANLATGQIGVHVALNAEVWTSASASKVCPRCSGSSVGAAGTCDSGPRKNQPCVTEGVVTVNSINPPVNGAAYLLSSDCPPGDAAHQKVATLPLVLDPLTTGAITLPGPRPCAGQTQDDACGGAACVESCPETPPLPGGTRQFCCDNQVRNACFPTRTGSIVRTGRLEVPTPEWPDTTYPKTGVGGAQLASVFCVPKTNSNVDPVSGLPGPGTLVLPVRQCWRKPGQTCP